MNADIIPNKLPAGSHKFAYWICPHCGSVSKQEIRKRIISKYGCSKCGDRAGRESRKLGIEEMQKLAASKNGECLSTKYVNSQDKLTWKCIEGHVWEATPNNIKSKDSWCPNCVRNAPLSIEDMHIWANKKGGKCLSKIYYNSSTMLKWECNKRHIWKATPNSIRQGSWCLICSGSEKKTLNDAKKLAELKGGKCLSQKYINANTKLKWECGKGHVWEATFSSIWNLDTWCPLCRGYGKTIKDMRKMAGSKKGKCLSEKYIDKNTKLRWQCRNGHIWEASPHNVKKGHWCPICSQGISERICRKYFEVIFGGKFPKQRPSWLISSKGYRLELDGYCKKLELAFEYQGRQHYQDIDFFNGKSDFMDRVKKDELKRKLCEEHKVVLIDVPYNVNYEDMGNYITEQCKNKGIKIPEQNEKIDYKQFNVYSPKKLEELRKIAKDRGGECLSERYVNAHTKLRWRCKEGHEWEARPYSIKNLGTWCPYCKKEFEEL